MRHIRNVAHMWLLFSIPALAQQRIACAERSDARDLFCGPRCVWFVLVAGGQSMELIDVIRESQWPDVGNGTSVVTLQQVLKQHGVDSIGIQSGQASLPEWRFLSILHLKAGAGSPHGHYVVMLPWNGTGDVTIWDGIDGFQIYSQEQLCAQSSGVALLTARASLDSKQVLQQLDDGSHHQELLILNAFLLLALAVVPSLRLKRSPLDH